MPKTILTRQSAGAVHRVLIDVRNVCYLIIVAMYPCIMSNRVLLNVKYRNNQIIHIEW